MLLHFDLCAFEVMRLSGFLGDQGPTRAAPMMTAMQTVPMTAVQDDDLETVPVVIVAIVPANMPALRIHVHRRGLVADIVVVDVLAVGIAVITVIVSADRKAADTATGTESYESGKRQQT